MKPIFYSSSFSELNSNPDEEEDEFLNSTSRTTAGSSMYSSSSPTSPDVVNQESPSSTSSFPIGSSLPPSFKSNLLDYTSLGLRLAHVISTTCYHMAAHVNRKAEKLADRGITATAGAISSKATVIAEKLRLDNHWQQLVDGGIQSSSGKLVSLSLAITSGIHSALSTVYNITSKGINWSLGIIQQTDQEDYLRTPGFLQALQHAMDVFTPLTNYSMLDVARALRVYSRIQEAAGVPYPPTRGALLDLSKRENRDFLSDLVYRFRQTLAAYDPGFLRLCRVGVKSASSSDLIRELLGLDPDSILVKRECSEVVHPAYFIILCNSSRSICVIIRGTTQAADVMTDFCCKPISSSGFHGGMESSAISIDVGARPVVRELCQKYPTYKVIIEGHSLGGGTATLLCLLWLKDTLIAGPDGRRLHAYSFGAPAVIPLGTSRQYYNNVTSVVYARDIVSRASWGSLTSLTKVLLYLCSKKAGDNHSSPVTRFSEFYSDISTPSSNRSNRSDQLKNQLSSVLSDRFSLPSEPPRRSLTEYHRSSTVISCSSYPFPPSQLFLGCLDSLSIDVLSSLLKKRNSTSSASQSVRDFWQLQISSAASALRSLHSEENVLSVAGRCIVVMPAKDYVSVAYPSHHHLTAGGAVLFELDHEGIVQLSQNVMFTRESFKHHYPLRLAKALELRLPSDYYDKDLDCGIFSGETFFFEEKQTQADDTQLLQKSSSLTEVLSRASSW